ncbi:MAG: septation regulator SpoVG [Erysipelotrichales bacterium]|nr:septation regulator SpoVG [Erysipelotrichales bacterium]
MEVTNVRIRISDSGTRLKAEAAITFDDCFVVHEVKIIQGDEELFITMPSKKLPRGDFKDTVHPINHGFRAHIEEAVLKAYNIAVLNKESDSLNFDSQIII